MKKLFFTLLVLVSFQMGIAQSLEKMQWFNEPEEWEIKDNSLSMFVTPQSDYWRISHYGFTVDDAPFYYTTYGGEFEVKVKVTGDYKQRFDQAGLMLRIDHENYIKTGIEFVDGPVLSLSTVSLISVRLLRTKHRTGASSRSINRFLISGSRQSDAWMQLRSSIHSTIRNTP